MIAEVGEVVLGRGHGLWWEGFLLMRWAMSGSGEGDVSVEDGIRDHCRELDRCNQRGGRMLSIVDLLEAGTVDLELAGYLMSRVARGASFMVGARPGGAGKTTVMCALLNLCPPAVRLVAATPEVVRRGDAEPAMQTTGFVCHEIGPGPYFAYLWGADLRAYCALGARGAMLATNLHADDLEEARDQVCADNGVPEAHFNGFGLLAFLRVRGGLFGGKRVVEKVYESDGASRHQLVYERGAGSRGAPADAWRAGCRGFIEGLQARGMCTIAEVRRETLGFLAKQEEKP